MKVKVTIERGADGTYDACMEFCDNLDFGLLGQGKTAKEAISDFYACMNDMKAHYEKEGKSFPKDLDFEFKYDVPAFLSEYSNIISLAGLSRLTGINQYQLSHYLNGFKTPKKSTSEKIASSIHSFASELKEIEFV
jgi:predicted RNase H-like HicB family nuclease